MEIRYLTYSDDRKAISRIYEESWKYAYKGIIPQDYLNSIPAGRWAASFDHPDWHTLVCTEQGKLVGTSSFCKSGFEQFAGWGEIISIYLLPDYMGKGFGKPLLQAAIVELKKMGYNNIFLWALEENLRAERFYEKAGFSRTEDYLEDNIGGKALREVRYIYEN